MSDLWRVDHDTVTVSRAEVTLFVCFTTRLGDIFQAFERR